MSGEQYGDYGNPIVKALLRGWNVALGRWIPIAVDADGHPQMDVQSLPAIADNWHPILTAEVADNSSDKTFTVPAATEYQVLSLLVDLVTTATAGNRQISVIITTGADVVISEARAGVVQAASLTRRYSFGIGAADLLAFRDINLLTTPLPVLVLPAGYKIRVYDKTAVDAAADDMHVQMLVNSRAV